MAWQLAQKQKGPKGQVRTLLAAEVLRSLFANSGYKSKGRRKDEAVFKSRPIAIALLVASTIGTDAATAGSVASSKGQRRQWFRASLPHLDSNLGISLERPRGQQDYLRQRTNLLGSRFGGNRWRRARRSRHWKQRWTRSRRLQETPPSTKTCRGNSKRRGIAYLVTHSRGAVDFNQALPGRSGKTCGSKAGGATATPRGTCAKMPTDLQETVAGIQRL